MSTERNLPRARFQESCLQKPSTGPRDVTTTLADFAIITYAVHPQKLQNLLPEEFVPEEFTLSNGQKCALISAVPFRDLDFRFGLAPWLRFQFGQTNYRAYVIYQGKRCVWFFGTSLATLYVTLPRYWWKLPWHPASMKFTTSWEENRCAQYLLQTRGTWGEATVELEGSKESVGCLDGFQDEEDSLVVLSHPLDGYFYRRDGKIGTYSVWHDKLNLQRGYAKQLYFSVFENLGLIDKKTQPHSILLQKETEFIIFLPPRSL